MDNAIEQLLNRYPMWRASNVPTERSILATGFAALGKALHYRGWPAHGLSEFLLEQPGIGELRLLMPALAQLSQDKDRWILFVGIPHLPYAPMLANEGFNLERLWVVKTKDQKETEWAAEQALKSGTCSAVITWLQQPSQKLRRLHLAAEQGKSWGITFRPTSASRNPSPAKLRIQLSPTSAGLGLHIIKQPGGWGGQHVELKQYLNTLSRISTQALPVHQPQTGKLPSAPLRGLPTPSIQPASTLRVQ